MATEDSTNLKWWIENNRSIEVQEGGDPDEAETRTREFYKNNPLNFEIPVEGLGTMAAQAVYKAACRNLVAEGIYSPKPDLTPYESVFDQATFESETDIRDMHPMSVDLVQFTMWLQSKGFIIEVDALDPAHAVEALADLAIEYTGE